MASLDDLMDSASPQLYAEAVTTGFTELDALTGGLLPGALWVVLGTPGAGRTIFATQLALTAATRGEAQTGLLLGRETKELALLNIYSQTARIPAQQLQVGIDDPDDEERLRQARGRLRGAPLSIWPCAERLALDDPDLTERVSLLTDAKHTHRVLVADDVDHLDLPLWEPWNMDFKDSLPVLRARARSRNLTLVVTMPEEGWLESDAASPELRRDADVVLRIVRAEMFEHLSPRAGEADFELLRNRTGPTRTLTVAFQGHYKRFVSFP